MSPAQLEAALRRAEAAEEACAKMSAVAREATEKAVAEARRRATAERDVAALMQIVRDLRDRLPRTKEHYMLEEEARYDARMARPWCKLQVRVSVAAPVDCVKAAPKPYAQFLDNPELADAVTKTMHALVSQTWRQEAVPMLQLTADMKTVLATYLVVVAFETHWNPTLFLREFRTWELKKPLSEEALKTMLATYLCIKDEDVRGWCMNYAVELLRDQWGFDLTPMQEKCGPPVPADASLDKKVVPHLYSCLYDMGETEPDERDPCLLGIVGPRRARLQLVPPRWLRIPHPEHGSRIVWLTWRWPASPDCWLTSGTHSRGEDEVFGGKDAVSGGVGIGCQSVTSSDTSVRQLCSRERRKARGRESTRLILGRSGANYF